MEINTKYDKLYDVFYQNILGGVWSRGARIPPERQLCSLYSVSRITVRETLRKLEQRGLITRVQGKGTFVHINPVEQKMTKLYTLREQFVESGIRHHVSILEFSIIPADMNLCEKLSIPENDKVIKILRLFFAADTPYTLEDTYLPCASFSDLSEEMVEKNGLYNSFSEKGIIVERAIERLKPISVDKSQSQFLQVSTNDVAMKIERTSFWRENIIEYTESIVRGDIFVYSVELN